MFKSPYIQQQFVTTRIDRDGKIRRTLIIKSSVSEDSSEYRGLLESLVAFTKTSNDIDQVEVSGAVEVSRHAPHDFHRSDAKAPLFASARPLVPA